MRIKFLKDLIFCKIEVKTGDILEVNAADPGVRYCLGRKLAVVVENQKPATAPAETDNKQSEHSDADDQGPTGPVGGPGDIGRKVPDDFDFMDETER